MILPIAAETGGACELTDCVNLFLEKEDKVRCRCAQCGLDSVVQQTALMSLPEYLILHLKRFNPDGTKNNAHVGLNGWLCLRDSNGNEKIYELATVAHHQDVLEREHYSADSVRGTEWVCFDDSLTRVVTEYDVQQPSETSYLIFMKGVNSGDATVPIGRPTPSTSLAIDMEGWTLPVSPRPDCGSISSRPSSTCQ